ncbi:metallophosphoesterase [Natronoflexus pectinivorans]|uniref:Calcineurin-like phosphoesterase family protein n=1 Tax=Natronoflexus pectinivorans TaxID=682526 RepID=A0A4R2G8M3_9BACT|nr:metallophosphoesterase [Natronoflexus pectinivorans]TCO04012.1 calcineurin-like phosphoesterase family protein [Natronoflexus pectinivorans]
MNILVIADLHIGNNDFFETFGWNADEFIESMELVIKKAKIDKVVLNGDIFELYKYTYKEICQTQHKLITYFKNPKFVMLQGNHDAINGKARENLTITNEDGKTIFIEHGHSVDFMNGSRIGRKIQTFLHTILRHIIKFKWAHKTYFKILEFDDAINRVPRKYNSYKYLKHALKLLKVYDMVIMGHTHKLEAYKTYYLQNKKQYINCGSCSMGRFQGVIVNTNKMIVETLKFKNKAALFKEFKKQRNVVPAKMAVSA